MREQSFTGHGHGGGPLERLAGGLEHALAHARDADDLARADGLLQRLDPRTKVVCLVGLVIIAISLTHLTALAAFLLLALALAASSRIRMRRLALQAWLPVLAFTGLISLPAVFIVPGTALVHLPLLGWPITAEGVRSALFLTMRAMAATSFCLLLILTTPWPHVLKALRSFRVPAVVVMLIGMTHRYLFVLCETALAMFEARRARTVGTLAPKEARRLATQSAGVLFARSLDISHEVHLAMIARGYRGDIRLIDDFRFASIDACAFCVFAAVAAAGLGFFA